MGPAAGIVNRLGDQIDSGPLLPFQQDAADLGPVAMGDDHTIATGHEGGDVAHGLADGRVLVGDRLVRAVADQRIASDSYDGRGHKGLSTFHPSARS